MMALNIRDLLLTPVELPRETVLLPELGEGVSVIVKGMNAKEKGAFDMQFVKKGEHDIAKQKQMRERMVVACCINEDGSKVFTFEDVAALGLQRVDVIERIFDACQRLCGSDKKADAEKNLEQTDVC